MAQNDNLSTLTVKELKELAKEAGVVGYYKLRKQELVDALSVPRQEIIGEVSGETAAVDEVPIESVERLVVRVVDDNARMKSMSVKDLKELAKKEGLSGYYKLRKQELVDLLLKKHVDESVPTDLEATDIPEVVTDVVVEARPYSGPMTGMSFNDLRKLAKENGIRGFSVMRKGELIDAIREPEIIEEAVAEVAARIAGTTSEKTIQNAKTVATNVIKEKYMKSLSRKGTPELRDIAKQVKLPGVLINSPRVILIDLISDAFAERKLSDVALGIERVEEPIRERPNWKEYVSDMLREIQVSETDQYLKKIDRQILECLGMY